MKGSLLQLVAFGAEDLVLTADPDITFFNTIYKRHSVFSIESIQLNFTDIPQFNSTSVILIKKNGDLLSRLYLEVSLPYDENLTDSYWTNMDKAEKRSREIGGRVNPTTLYEERGTYYQVKMKEVIVDPPSKKEILDKLSPKERKVLGI